VEIPAGGTTLVLHDEDPFEVERRAIFGGIGPRFTHRCVNCQAEYVANQPQDPDQPWTQVCSLCLHEQL
jgi:hypothetical protein